VQPLGAQKSPIAWGQHSPAAALAKGRALVRFGHTGEYSGWVGQVIAALASLGACFLVYTGFSLSIRRLAAKRRTIVSPQEIYVQQTG